MTVDPADDCTFWYTQHVATNGTTGRPTQIASFRFDNCGTDLSITKTANTDLVHAGEELFYEITVTNEGNNDATGVTVVDTLPSGVTFLNASTTCVVTGLQQLTCDLGAIANGDSSTFTIKVKVDADLVVTDPDGSTTITNTATVSADQPETDDSDNEASVTTFVEEWADLQVTKVCKPDRQATAGEDGVCTIVVQNLGTSDARNVVLEDKHLSDSPFTIVSATAPCVISGSTVTCGLGSLAAGASQTVEVKITSDVDADVNDIATVTSDTPDPDTSNNSAEGHLSFGAIADLAITKTDTPDPVRIGDQLTYELTVTNNGPSDAVNVVIEDNLPAGVEIDSVNSSAGTCNAGVPGDASRPTTCTFDTLPSNGSETMTIVMTVPASVSQTLVNDAKVSSDVADPDNSNNLATTHTTVIGADIWIDKVVDTSSTTNPSRSVVYVVTVHNEPGCQKDDPATCGTGGPSNAENVVVTDTISSTDPKFMPKKVEIEFMSPNCQIVGELKIQCDAGTLASGGNVSFEIHVNTKGKVEGLLNSVEVTTSTFDPDLGNNSDEVLVNISGGGGNKGGPKP